MFFNKKTNDWAAHCTPEMDKLLRRAEELKRLKAKLYQQEYVYSMRDLMKTVWRSYQGKRLLEPYITDDNASGDVLEIPFVSIAESQKPKKHAYLDVRQHSILSFPWHPQRIIENLGAIGKENTMAPINQSRRLGEFESSTSHDMEYYWPLQVGIIRGQGHHSVSQGILSGHALIKIDKWYDITSIVDQYRYTGTRFIDRKTHAEIPHNSFNYRIPDELGYAWELSYLISKYDKPEENWIYKQ